MKVSIIIPVYNVSECIKDCLSSVYSQTYNNLEIIIVDDCGVDDSMKRVNDFINKSKIKRDVKIISHTHNRGLSAARNTGVENATGDYVFFLDSDDVIDVKCIEHLIAPLKRQSVDFVIGKFIVVNEDKQYSNLVIDEGIYCGNDLIMGLYTSGYWYAMAWNKLINREFLINNELYFKEGLLHEDILWSFKLACTANSMYAVHNETYSYIIRKNSISQNLGLKNCNALIEVIADSVSYYTSKYKHENKEVHNYIERLKISLLENMNKNYSRKVTYDFYKRCRLYIINIKTNNIKEFVRDFHYRFSPFWGFNYLLFLIKLKRLRIR